MDLKKVKGRGMTDTVIVDVNAPKKCVKDADFCSAFSNVSRVVDRIIVVCTFFLPSGEKVVGPVCICEGSKSLKDNGIFGKSGEMGACAENKFPWADGIDWRKSNRLLSSQPWRKLTKRQRPELLEHLGKNYAVPTFMVPIYGTPEVSGPNYKDVRRAIYCLPGNFLKAMNKYGFIVDTSLKKVHSISLTEFEAFCKRTRSKKPKTSLKIDSPENPDMNGKTVLQWINQIIDDIK